MILSDPNLDLSGLADVASEPRRRKRRSATSRRSWWRSNTSPTRRARPSSTRFSVNWRPTEDLTLNLSYVPLTNVNAMATYRAAEGVKVYGGFVWANEGYFLADRSVTNDRFLGYEKRLVSGVRWDFWWQGTLDLMWLRLRPRLLLFGQNAFGNLRDQVDGLCRGVHGANVRVRDRGAASGGVMDVHGDCDPRFAAVRDEFERNFASAARSARRLRRRRRPHGRRSVGRRRRPARADAVGTATPRSRRGRAPRAIVAAVRHCSSRAACWISTRRSRITGPSSARRARRRSRPRLSRASGRAAGVRSRCRPANCTTGTMSTRHAGRRDAVLGAGHAAGLSRLHVRPPRRRTGAAHLRQAASRFFRDEIAGPLGLDLHLASPRRTSRAWRRRSAPTRCRRAKCRGALRGAQRRPAQHASADHAQHRPASGRSRLTPSARGRPARASAASATLGAWRGCTRRSSTVWSRTTAGRDGSASVRPSAATRCCWWGCAFRWGS